MADIQGVLKGISQVLEVARQTSNVISDATLLQRLIAMHRDDALRELKAVVGQIPVDRFDEFERNFLHTSLLILNPEQRMRAMELYAFLKLLDYEGSQRIFRGFVTNGKALT